MLRNLLFLFMLILAALPAEAALKINDPAPAFSLSDLGKSQYSFPPSTGNDGRRGTIIAFFASWCMPCREELPLLNSLSSELHARGIRIVLVNVKEPAGTIREFVAGLGIDKPTVVSDRTGTVTEQYQVLFLPTTFFVGADGRVKDIIFGQIRDAAQLRKSAAAMSAP